MREQEQLYYGGDPAVAGLRLLCPELFHRLSRRIPGGGRVGVANSGEAATGYAGYAFGRNDRRFVVTSWGETYRVNCPFCSDTRGRLWVPHMYGQPDPADTRRSGDFYGICFNDECLTSRDNRRALWEMVYGLRNRNARFDPPQLDLDGAIRLDGRLIERPLPGVCEPLVQLADTHPALFYLLHTRRFSLQHAAHYQLHYCHSGGETPLAAGRIIAPIVMHGRQVGWQGRTPGEPHNKTTPKYYGCPGMPKRQMLYNYDRALGKPFVVVFEGWTDVLRLGDCSLALLGKTLTTQHRYLLEAGWPNREPIVFCLDPDAYEESQLAIHELAARGTNPVVSIRLPDGWDPADFDRDPLWTIIRTQAAERGVRLPERLP